MEKQTRKTSFLGVDLGGTKLLVGEMDAGGSLLAYKKYPSEPLSQTEAMKLITACVDDYLATARPAGAGAPAALGLGLVGRIDARQGVWLGIDPARNEEIPVARLLGGRYGLPCFADNDVRSATKAEMLFGRGRGTRHMVYINVGTGIAAGTVSDGRLIFGSHFNAGEVGHTASGIDLRADCVCGRPDCVESVASGLGLDKCARLLAPRFPGTALHIPQNGARVSAAEIFERYDADPLCKTLADNAAEGLANLIMNLVRMSDPDTIVLGGGVMTDGFLYRKVLERLNPYTIRFVTGGVVLTGLDPAFVGLMGACSNAIKGMEETT